MKIKVLSLNIWEGKFLDQAIAFIAAENPDILLLQEVYGQNDPTSQKPFRTLEILLEKLDFAHHYFEPSLRHNCAEGLYLQGNAVLSKFPIIATDAVFYNDPYNDNFTDGPEFNHAMPHTLQHAELQTPLGIMHAYNLHGTWDLDGDNFSVNRQKMSQAIINAVSGKSKVILAGDTNAKPTNKAMQLVEEHLHSVFGTSLVSTFNMRHKDNPGYATAAVDMMFVSKDITVIDKKCSDADVSDHLALVVTVEV